MHVFLEMHMHPRRNKGRPRQVLAVVVVMCLPLRVGETDVGLGTRTQFRNCGGAYNFGHLLYIGFYFVVLFSSVCSQYQACSE